MFRLDCTVAVEDEVINTKGLEKFLREKIKVNGKKGNLGENIRLNSDTNAITVNSSIAFSKRYLKYLTKKYLKKLKIADYLRVVAPRKDTYELRYLKIYQEQEEEEA